MDAAVDKALQALACDDWDGLRGLLHPYVHWTTAAGDRVRGRTKVLAMLADGDVPAVAPASSELRDGQIYRWTVARQSKSPG